MLPGIMTETNPRSAIGFVPPNVPPAPAQGCGTVPLKGTRLLLLLFLLLLSLRDSLRNPCLSFVRAV